MAMPKESAIGAATAKAGSVAFSKVGGPELPQGFQANHAMTGPNAWAGGGWPNMLGINEAMPKFMPQMTPPMWKASGPGGDAFPYGAATAKAGLDSGAPPPGPMGPFPTKAPPPNGLAGPLVGSNGSDSLFGTAPGMSSTAMFGGFLSEAMAQDGPADAQAKRQRLFEQATGVPGDGGGAGTAAAATQLLLGGPLPPFDTGALGMSMPGTLGLTMPAPALTLATAPTATRVQPSPPAMMPPAPMPLDDKSLPFAPPPVEEKKLSEEDAKWRDSWAEVFTTFMEDGIESRAGEYAEAVVALWQQVDTLRRQLAVAQQSCDQLLHTASREALRSHMQYLLESASAGVPLDLQEAAKKEVEANLQVQSPSVPGVPDILAPKLLNLVSPPSGALSAGQKSAGSRSETTAQRSAEQQVYVSGLPPGIDDSMFRQLFASYGSVVSAKTTPEKNEGVVSFARSQDAQAAVNALNNFEFNGTKLSVRLEARDESRPPQAALTLSLGATAPGGAIPLAIPNL